MNFEPIGTVKSPVQEAVDEDWGAVVSEIHVMEPLAAGLEGLDQFSHVVIILAMHEATFDPASDLRRHPQGLDATEGIPVLDIKPYVPAFDTVADPTVPEWLGRLMQGYFS